MNSGIIPQRRGSGEPPPALHRVVVTDDTVPLAWAALCVDSDTVFDLRAGACPACGSKAMLPLARVLGTEVAA